MLVEVSLGEFKLCSWRSDFVAGEAAVYVRLARLVNLLMAQ
jgi:hypothetical protein